ncbi:MAG: hypothetical protein ACI9Y1_001421 [Lentisphaeria bacterium]|jgi:hypothetical protein
MRKHFQGEPYSIIVCYQTGPLLKDTGIMRKVAALNNMRVCFVGNIEVLLAFG